MDSFEFRTYLAPRPVQFTAVQTAVGVSARGYDHFINVEEEIHEVPYCPSSSCAHIGCTPILRRRAHRSDRPDDAGLRRDRVAVRRLVRAPGARRGHAER